MKTQSLQEFLAEEKENPERLVHMPTGWKLQRLNGTSRWFICHSGYDIALDECKSTGQKNDWIQHMKSKSWVTDEMLGGLVRFLFSFDSSMSERDYRKVLERMPHEVVTE